MIMWWQTLFLLAILVAIHSSVLANPVKRDSDDSFFEKLKAGVGEMLKQTQTR